MSVTDAQFTAEGWFDEYSPLLGTGWFDKEWIEVPEVGDTLMGAAVL